MATMKTLNGYGFNATEFNGKAASDYLQKTDTATNSAKLGGKAPEYYIQPRNLLDNSDFRNPVNQRGKTSYSGIWIYTIDRWKAWVDNSNPGTVAVVDGGITPYPGVALQRIESKYIDSSKIYTLAAMTGDGLLVLSGKIESKSKGTTNANNGIYFNYHTGNDVYQIMLFGSTNASKFIWAALYEGSYTADTLPPYVPKGYVAELAECHRYFQRHTFKKNETISLSYQGPTYCFIQLPLYRNMRINSPSLVHTDGLVTIGKKTHRFSKVAHCLTSTAMIFQNYENISNPAQFSYCYTTDAAGLCFDISADL